MIETTAALILFLFPLAYSPGPGNMFFAANGAMFGLRATLWASVGYHVATVVVTLAIGAGFVAVQGRWPALMPILRLAGSLYVLWLAWLFWRAGAVGDAGKARPAGFASGVMLLVLNPKAYVIIALMFSQFLAGSERRNLWLITGVFTLNNLVAFTAWTLAGDLFLRRFRSGAGARRLNRVFAVVLALVALWMLLG